MEYSEQETVAIISQRDSFGCFRISFSPTITSDVTPGGQRVLRFTWRTTDAPSAQRMAGHEFPRTTKLYDRTKDEITLRHVDRTRLVSRDDNIVFSGEHLVLGRAAGAFRTPRTAIDRNSPRGRPWIRDLNLQ